MAVLTQRAAAAAASAADPAAVDAALAGLEGPSASRSTPGSATSPSSPPPSPTSATRSTAPSPTGADALALGRRPPRSTGWSATARRGPHRGRRPGLPSRPTSRRSSDVLRRRLAGRPRSTAPRPSCEALGEGRRADELAVGPGRRQAPRPRRVVVDRTALFDADGGGPRSAGHTFGTNTTPFDLHLAVGPRRPRAGAAARPAPTLGRPGAGVGGRGHRAGGHRRCTRRRRRRCPGPCSWPSSCRPGGRDLSDARAEAQGRLDDGFELGIHDADAAGSWRPPPASAMHAGGLWVHRRVRAAGAGVAAGGRRDRPAGLPGAAAGRVQALGPGGPGSSRVVAELAPSITAWGGGRGGGRRRRRRAQPGCAGRFN